MYTTVITLINSFIRQTELKTCTVAIFCEVLRHCFLTPTRIVKLVSTGSELNPSQVRIILSCIHTQQTHTTRVWTGHYYVLTTEQLKLLITTGIIHKQMPNYTECWAIVNTHKWTIQQNNDNSPAQVYQLTSKQTGVSRYAAQRQRTCMKDNQSTSAHTSSEPGHIT